jgi:predicted alpha/beta hydrolase family esterase
MKRAIILHGWGGTPEKGFKPWLKRALEQHGYQLYVPALPNTDRPILEEWLATLNHIVGVPDQDTVLIGHSLGGLLVLKYLESLPKGKRIGKAILVAPVVDAIIDMNDEEQSIANPWLEKQLDGQKILTSVGSLSAFFSDDDPAIPLSSESVLRNWGGVHTIVEHQMGHYNEETNITEVPTVLAEILK